ncbi:MAG: energy transducer TonB [Ferruginibacter sp.]
MKKSSILAILLITCLYSIAQGGKDSGNTVIEDSALRYADKIFTRVEVEANFPGGDAAWRRYLQLNLDPNTPVKNKAPDGTYQIIIRFVVKKDGTINNVVAETSHGYGMEAEAIRIIKNGPNWVPASQNGRNVNAYRRQPITFVVNGY